MHHRSKNEVKKMYSVAHRTLTVNDREILLLCAWAFDGDDIRFSLGRHLGAACQIYCSFPFGKERHMKALYE